MSAHSRSPSSSAPPLPLYLFSPLFSFFLSLLPSFLPFSPHCFSRDKFECALDTREKLVIWDVVELDLSFQTRVRSSSHSSGRLRSGPRSVSGKGNQSVSAKGKFGHLTLPGALRYSVPQPERRKSFFLSEESARAPSIYVR